MNKIRKNYCWVVVCCAALLAFCSNGLTANCISIYLGYMRSIWGYTNSEISVYNSVRSLFSLFSVFAMGWMFRHMSLRAGAALWCAMHGLAYILGAWGDSRAMFYLSGALLGFSFSLCNLTVGSMFIRRWFWDKLGFALGIFSCSTGVATLLAPSIITHIVERSSLRVAYIGEGIFIVISALVVYLLVRSHPGEMDLEPYTLPKGAKEGTKRSKHVVLQSNGPVTRGEWVFLCVIFLLLGLGNSQALSNFSLHFADCGFAPEQIAIAVSAYGVGIGLTKVVYGFAVDRFGGNNSTTYCASFLVMGFIVICVVKYVPSAFLMILSTTLCGIGFTALSVGGGIWAAELNTPENYDESLRRFQLLQMVGSVVGSLIPGILADHFGSYVPAYAFTVVCVLVFLVGLRRMYARKTHVVSTGGSVSAG